MTQATLIRYPRPRLQPRSITDGIPIGTSQEHKLTLRVAGNGFTYVFGPRGSGITTLVRTTLLGVVQCHDALPTVIDLDGVELAYEFLTGWENGEDQRPPLNWVATTLDEAKTMLTFAYQLASERSARFRSHRVAPIGSTDDAPPMVYLVVASGMEQIAADPAAAGLLARVAEHGPQWNVTGMITGRRWTNHSIPPQVSAWIDTRIAIGPVEQDDLQAAGEHLIGNNVMPRENPGDAWAIGTDDCDAPMPFRVWLSTATDVGNHQHLAAHHQPELEQTELTDLGTAYTERWARAGRDLFGPDVPDRITKYGQVRPLDLAAASTESIVRRLRRNPHYAHGTRLSAAIDLLASMSGGQLFQHRIVRRALTVDRSDLFIDWQEIATYGRDLLRARTPDDPGVDAGYALVLAAGLATGQITTSGVRAIAEAFTTAATRDQEAREKYDAFLKSTQDIG